MWHSAITPVFRYVSTIGIEKKKKRKEKIKKTANLETDRFQVARNVLTSAIHCVSTHCDLSGSSRSRRRHKIEFHYCAKKENKQEKEVRAGKEERNFDRCSQKLLPVSFSRLHQESLQQISTALAT